MIKKRFITLISALALATLSVQRAHGDTASVIAAKVALHSLEYTCRLGQGASASYAGWYIFQTAKGKETEKLTLKKAGLVCLKSVGLVVAGAVAAEAVRPHCLQIPVIKDNQPLPLERSRHSPRERVLRKLR